MADGTMGQDSKGFRSKIKNTSRESKAEIEGLENTLIHLTEEAHVQDLEPSPLSINRAIRAAIRASFLL
ncbi:hypothetical protein Tco_1265729 [Tanacetum coccineum]